EQNVAHDAHKPRTEPIPTLSSGQGARPPCRINDGAIGLRNCARGKPRLIDMVRVKNVEYVFASANKIIGNDPPVAPPPNGFCTHDRSAPIMPAILELSQTLMELLRHCVIRVVSETEVVPEKVGRNIDSRPISQSAKRSHVGIPYLNHSQLFGQCFSVELRVGAGARYVADINHELNL